MSKKAEVRVDLDTAPAKAKLREFAKEGEATALRTNDSLASGLGRAGALGAAAGVGFGIAQRAASRIGGWMPDVITEGTAGDRATWDAKWGNVESRAASQARQETANTFREIVGRMENPSVTPSIRNYYENIRGLREITERGESVINQELGGTIVSDAVNTIVEAVTSGFNRLVDALPLGGK